MHILVPIVAGAAIGFSILMFEVIALLARIAVALEAIVHTKEKS